MSNGLDMKYELFCKWLQENEQIQTMPSQNTVPDQQTNQNSLSTEDEVSSFATNDSDSDVFLDTESDFPSIILSDADEGVSFNSNLMSDFKTASIDEQMLSFGADTPSQLSVSDFDCSSSDITVNSRMSPISDTSIDQTKPKAKSKKRRAPPIPTLINKSDGISNLDGLSLTFSSKTDLQQSNEHETHTNSHLETDI